MRVTANQVTMTRLFLMPALCWLVYGDETLRVWVLIIGSFVGMTDFVDGYLARRQGPTVLGGLMDPIADKVFIAVCFVPFADLGYVPWQAVAALFLREYLVTALRSSFEHRQRQLRSTYLSKVKTWTQMTALGLVMLMIVVHSQAVLRAVFIGMAVAPAVGGVVFWLVKRRLWMGSVLGAVMHGIFAWIFIEWGAHAAMLATIWVMVALTWVSAFDYVSAAVAVIKEPTRFDLSRLVPAAGLPLIGIWGMVHGALPEWTVIAVLAIELAHGGLDNHLAHHDAAAPPWVWLGRQLFISGAFAVALAWPAQGAYLGALAVAVSTAGTATTFWSRRRYYIEPKLRDKKRAVPEPA